jgi:cytidylate kinase
VDGLFLYSLVIEVQALVQRDLKGEAQTQQAADAVVLDTTFLTQEEQVERIVAMARQAMRGAP